MKRKGKGNERDEKELKQKAKEVTNGREELQRKDGCNEMDLLKGKEEVNEPDVRLKTKGKK